MTWIPEWLKQAVTLRQTPETNGSPVVSEAPPVRCALVRKGGEFQITFTDSIERGVRIVEMPAALEKRYWLAYEEWKAVQLELALLDYTHRKRKTRKRPTLESIAARDVEPAE